MDICLVLQLYFAMAQSHMDVAKNHAKIAEVGQSLQAECAKVEKEKVKSAHKDIQKEEKKASEEKKPEEKKSQSSIGQTKLEPKDK